MKARFNILDWVAMALLVVGGLNWGLVGLFEYDLVAEIFGGSTEILSRIVYSLVGLAAVFGIYTSTKMTNIATETNENVERLRKAA